MHLVLIIKIYNRCKYIEYVNIYQINIEKYIIEKIYANEL
jgi:hypothetical protein